MLLAITPLPSPPLLSGLLDGQPWLISGILLFAAFAVYQLTRSDTLSRSGRLGAAALIFLAIALQILAAAITTPREELARATRQLVETTAKADTAALSPLLAEDCRLYGESLKQLVRIPPQGLEKPGILTGVSNTLGAGFAPSEFSIRDIQSEATAATVGRTQVSVHAVIGGVPGNSWWRIGWRKNPSGEWQATSIEPLELPYGGMGG